MRKFIFIMLLMLAPCVGGSQENIKRNMFGYFTNLAKSAATKVEVRNIAHMIYLDYIGGESLPSQSEFLNYVRTHNKAPRGNSRDTAYDMWKRAYRLVVDSKGFEVVSLGPDGIYDSDDDIVYGYNL